MIRAHVSISTPLWNCFPLMSHTPEKGKGEGKGEGKGRSIIPGYYIVYIVHKRVSGILEAGTDNDVVITFVWLSLYTILSREREGGREREGEREGEKESEGGREGEGERERGREGERERGREGEGERGEREGGRERGKEVGREGGERERGRREGERGRG